MFINRKASIMFFHVFGGLFIFFKEIAHVLSKFLSKQIIMNAHLVGWPKILTVYIKNSYCIVNSCMRQLFAASIAGSGLQVAAEAALTLLCLKSTQYIANEGSLI